MSSDSVRFRSHFSRRVGLGGFFFYRDHLVIAIELDYAESLQKAKNRRLDRLLDGFGWILYATRIPTDPFTRSDHACSSTKLSRCNLVVPTLSSIQDELRKKMADFPSGATPQRPLAQSGAAGGSAGAGGPSTHSSPAPSLPPLPRGRWVKIL